MKRYLSTLFIALSVVIVIIGNSLGLYWGGIAAWGIAFILLIFAVYCTKYIPNERQEKPMSMPFETKSKR